MKSNYHSHTTYCDGNNTPREMVISAIEKGFDSFGFSAHGYTAFDLRYCVKDMDGYIKEITELKKEFKGKIDIYLGIEEDAFYLNDREKFDYIIGSSHYFNVGGKYYPIDSNHDCFKKCLEVFNYDVIRLSDTYYKEFVSYIKRRKPDIVGHFDLITKFDEMGDSLFLENKEYIELSKKYMDIVISNDLIFEVNTGAISRGYRKNPYPHESLLYVLKKKDARLTLSSDTHNKDTLDTYFEESKEILKDIGFKYLYSIKDGEFKRFEI